MASTSAHFNLTKPATTDYYNIGVFNDNTDIIDTQMYNNQVSAAKIMVGATANDDGESGRVPVPHAGDQDKYLCADGTWKTVSGGGGGSTVTITPILSSGTKIADYSIDGVSDSLYAPSGGGGGGIDYSTSEQDTGLKWIDNSSIYQKTINIVNSSAVVATRDIDLSSYVPSGARVIEFSGIYEYVYSSKNYGYMIGNGFVYCSVEDSVYKLKIVLGNGTVSSDEINLTIKYTKAS